MITFKHKGNFEKTDKFFKESVKIKGYKRILERYGDVTCDELRNATPIDSGRTKDSWYYEVSSSNNTITLSICNSEMADMTPVVILIKYGHVTKNGGYVSGNDFINPIVERITKDIKNKLFNEVIK